VTASDDGELKQLVVGLITQIYYANRDEQDAYSSEVTAGLKALVPGLTPGPLDWSGNLPQTPQELEAVLAEVAEKATLQASQKAYSALAYMIGVFYDFAEYAEQASPDLDVPEFLREAGIRAASGE
jgi:hypothetical protein